MRGAVTGSHGLIGSALVPALEAGGDTVVRLVRRRPAGPDEVFWDPESGHIEAAALEGLDYVVHLAGANIGRQPWTRRQRRRIRESRVEGTALLARTLAGLRAPPATMLSGSAVGFYGDRGDEELTEESPGGAGFRAEVCRAWEAATHAADEAGIQVVHLRSGIVLSDAGGLFPYLLAPSRIGVALRLGSGRQFWSWIAIDDEVEAIRFLIGSGLRGAVNVTSPNPVRQEELARAIAATRGGRVVGVPASVLELTLGPQRAREVLLAGERAIPRRLLDAGFRFRFAQAAEAIRSIVVERRAA